MTKVNSSWVSTRIKRLINGDIKDIIVLKSSILNLWCFKYNPRITLIDMLRYHCTNCSYIYNPYMWDEESSIDPWTDFSDVGEFWVCPICWWSKDDFVEIKEHINEISNPDDLFPEEERHIPFYTEMEDGKVNITIWSEDEPFVQDDVHYVEYVWLFDDDGWVIDIANFPDNEVTLDSFWVEEYEVRASCSMHWVWKWIKLNQNNEQ